MQPTLFILEGGFFSLLLALGIALLWSAWERSQNPLGPRALTPWLLPIAALSAQLLGWSWRLPLHSYSTLLVLGFLAAVALSIGRARQRGWETTPIIDLAIVAVVSGVLGARLFHVLSFWGERFAHDPARAFALWEGGFVFYGGLFSAVLCGALWIWRAGLPVLAAGDIVAPCLPLGLAFGRIGCLLNGCCWGQEVAEGTFLSLRYPRGSFAWWQQAEPYFSKEALELFDRGLISLDQLCAPLPSSLCHYSAPVAGSQIYSVLGALGLMALLLIYENSKKRREGQVFALFFLLYAPLRFLLETTRGDSALLGLEEGALSPAQRSSLALFGIALIGFVLISRSTAKTSDSEDDHSKGKDCARPRRDLERE